MHKKTVPTERPKIGKIVWCPQLGAVMILGILHRRIYEFNLLVETVDQPGRYWIDQRILQPRPEGRRALALVRKQNYTRLVTHANYAPPN
jgi:hypothetical protein